MGRSLISLFSASDEQLMWRVKLQDDPQAFARLVARWEKPIQRLCARMTGDTHRAEDLTQTAFARVFARRADWVPAGKFSTFLWRIALNLSHDELRRTRRRGEFSLEALEEVDGAGLESFASDEPAPDAQAESSERGELVRRALAELPAHYREVVVLRHYEGLKFREIARSWMMNAMLKIAQRSRWRYAKLIRAWSSCAPNSKRWRSTPKEVFGRRTKVSFISPPTLSPITVLHPVSQVLNPKPINPNTNMKNTKLLNLLAALCRSDIKRTLGGVENEAEVCDLSSNQVARS